MKALILVGGFGTRLRPLTFTCPKPCVEFGNKPIVCHQIQALLKAGVTQIILAINQEPALISNYLQKYTEQYGVKIVCSKENTPLGTGGPLALAKDQILQSNQSGCFFLLNSDVICDYPFSEMLQYHKNHGRIGTITVTPVQDPRKYGVILTDQEKKILQFIEKPQNFISNRINAGLYIFNTAILERIEIKPTSLEREIFPLLAEEGELFSFDLNSFWMDIGQPKDYLAGSWLYMQHLEQVCPQVLAKGPQIVGNVLIDSSVVIEEDCLIGPNVVIGPGCHVERGTRISQSVVLKNCKIGSYSWINGSILGWRSRVGRWVRIEGMTILGENICVKDELFLNAVVVLPHKELKESQFEENKIIL